MNQLVDNPTVRKLVDCDVSRIIVVREKKVSQTDDNGCKCLNRHIVDYEIEPIIFD